MKGDTLDRGQVVFYIRYLMKRVAMVLFLIASLLLMPQAPAACVAKAAVKMACGCCGKSHGCCDTKPAKTGCTVSAQANDRTASLDMKVLDAPVAAVIGEIPFFSMAGKVHSTAMTAPEQICSPPPLELNCIILI
jgi:hypothetical protein